MAFIDWPENEPTPLRDKHGRKWAESYPGRLIVNGVTLHYVNAQLSYNGRVLTDAQGQPVKSSDAEAVQEALKRLRAATT